MNDIIDRAQAYVRDVFAGDFSGHDCFHTMRVFRLATAIAEAEGADMTIVQLAALLHDVDDRKLSPETCETKARAVAFMRACDLPEEAIARVCEIISEVSFAGTDSAVPATIEGKCVQDADRLDAIGAIGAIGIARTFAYGGHAHRPIHDPDAPPALHMNREQYARRQSSSINHFYEKLLLLRDMMNTPTARHMAEQRHLYMQGFLDEFLAEWDGRR